MSAPELHIFGAQCGLHDARATAWPNATPNAWPAAISQIWQSDVHRTPLPAEIPAARRRVLATHTSSHVTRSRSVVLLETPDQHSLSRHRYVQKSRASHVSRRQRIQNRSVAAKDGSPVGGSASKQSESTLSVCERSELYDVPEADRHRVDQSSGAADYTGTKVNLARFGNLHEEEPRRSKYAAPRQTSRISSPSMEPATNPASSEQSRARPVTGYGWGSPIRANSRARESAGRDHPLQQQSNTRSERSVSSPYVMAVSTPPGSSAYDVTLPPKSLLNNARAFQASFSQAQVLRLSAVAESNSRRRISSRDPLLSHGSGDSHTNVLAVGSNYGESQSSLPSKAAPNAYGYVTMYMEELSHDGSSWKPSEQRMEQQRSYPGLLTQGGGGRGGSVCPPCRPPVCPHYYPTAWRILSNASACDLLKDTLEGKTPMTERA
jgi:hypothetical protein